MNRISKFGLFLFLIVGLVGCAVFLGDVTGALDLYQAQQATRRAEAEAARLQAEVELTRARADVTRAEGEAAVLESAARAVDNNTRLVTWYSLRGDLRAILGLVGTVGLAICAGALVVILKGVNDAQDKDR